MRLIAYFLELRKIADELVFERAQTGVVAFGFVLVLPASYGPAALEGLRLVPGNICPNSRWRS